MKNMVLGLVLGLASLQAVAAELPARFKAEVMKILPGVVRVQENEPRILELLDASDGIIGRLYLELIPDEQRRFGYAGTVEVAVLVDSGNRVIGVLPGENVETRRYLNRIRRAKFFTRWNGLTLAELPGKEVDAVTGATYSCEAVKHGVRCLAESHLEIRTEAEAAVERKAEIQRLSQRISRLKADLNSGEAMNQEPRKSNEVELRLIAAVEGQEAAEKFADERGLRHVVKRSRSAGPASAPTARRNRRPSATDIALAAYREEPSEARRAELRAAILADYEFHLGLRNRDNARALREVEKRLEVLSAGRN